MVCAQTCELRSEFPGMKYKVVELSSCSSEERGSSANFGEMDLGSRSAPFRRPSCCFMTLHGHVRNTTYVYCSARAMAADDAKPQPRLFTAIHVHNMDTLLAFVEVQCRGVKFYDLKDTELEFFDPVVLRREPENPHDQFCVAAFVPRPAAHRAQMLGHISRAAARWLSPLLLCDSLRVTA